VDSVDTSALLYLTARRRYLIGSKSEQVRTVKFEECNCEGCLKMNPIPSPRSTDFFVNLYIHNILEAVKLATTPVKLTSDVTQRKKEEPKKIQRKPVKPKDSQPVSSISTLWMTAKESLELREKEVPEKDIKYDLSDFITQGNEVDTGEQD